MEKEKTNWLTKKEAIAFANLIPSWGYTHSYGQIGEPLEETCTATYADINVSITKNLRYDSKPYRLYTLELWTGFWNDEKIGKIGAYTTVRGSKLENLFKRAMENSDEENFPKFNCSGCKDYEPTKKIRRIISGAK